MKISLPELSLVLLIGPSSSGKSFFAQKHFHPTEIVSSEYCRELISDDRENREVSKDAFDLLHMISSKRLKFGRFTVVDTANLRNESRHALLQLTRKYHIIPIALVFNLPENICLERNKTRAENAQEESFIHHQMQQLRHLLRNLKREGYQSIHIFNTPEEVEQVELERQELGINQKSDSGPFDIIGDIHGCFDELLLLLEKLGYQIKTTTSPTEKLPQYQVTNPPGRKLIFLGDLIDRGPKIVEVFHFVKHLVETGQALMVPGNHEKKLVRRMLGKEVQVSYGIQESLRQFQLHPPERTQEFIQFVDSLVSHYVLDNGNLVVAHAGLKESMHGRSSSEVRSFAMYGENIKKEKIVPTQHHRNSQSWAHEYRGKAKVVYGHTPVAEPTWLNQTISLDTGCVFGGKLSALRYPEQEVVSVSAMKTYCFPPKRFLLQLQKNAAKTGGVYIAPPPLSGNIQTPALPETTPVQKIQEATPVPVPVSVPIPVPKAHSAHSSKEAQTTQETSFRPPQKSSVPQKESLPVSKKEEESFEEEPSEPENHRFLEIEDVLGRRFIRTRFLPKLMVREEGSLAALEVLNRFSVSPDWLIYLPPSVSPCATSKRPEYLEHPFEAFTYYHRAGLSQLICEELHPGNRTVFLICRNSSIAKTRFGLFHESIGVCYNRIGQRCFPLDVEKKVIQHLQKLLEESQTWEKLQTDWICLEGVTLPKNAYKPDTFQAQYLQRNSAADIFFNQATALLTRAEEQGARVQGLLKYYQERQELEKIFVQEYQERFAPVQGFSDLKIALVHVLASEQSTHFNEDHLWHLKRIDELIQADSKQEFKLLKETRYCQINLNQSEPQKEMMDWWENMKEPGVVIKPLQFIPDENQQWKVQPALKCRRPHYLQLIYGPEYLLQKNNKRLRFRNLSNLRMKILKQFALGFESLERFVQNKPKSAIHECVAGILAIESEPINLCL